MAKNNDVPKDQPILIPKSARPTLRDLAETEQSDTVKRVLGTDKSTKISAFNSSI